MHLTQNRAATCTQIQRGGKELAKASNQKLKILYLMKIMMEKTDETHRFESLVSFEGWKPGYVGNLFCPMFESLVSFEGWKPRAATSSFPRAFESLVSFEGWKPYSSCLLLLIKFESLVSFEGWKPSMSCR